MPTLLLGIVILLLGGVFIWRGQAMRRVANPSPTSMKQAKQFRDAGVVIAVAGLVILLLSAVVLGTGRS